MAATWVPPFIFAVLFPDKFFAALDSAGTYGVLVLFGVITAAMAWQQRYRTDMPAGIQVR